MRIPEGLRRARHGGDPDQAARLVPTAELLVAGYWCASGPGGRSCVGSLLVAGYDAAGDLVACGQVGTGFRDSTRSRLYAQPHPTRRTTSDRVTPNQRGLQFAKQNYSQRSPLDVFCPRVAGFGGVPLGDLVAVAEHFGDEGSGDLGNELL